MVAGTGRGGAVGLVHQPHLAQKLARAEGGDHHLAVTHVLDDLDGAFHDEVGGVGEFPFVEKGLPFFQDNGLAPGFHLGGESLAEFLVELVGFHLPDNLRNAPPRRCRRFMPPRRRRPQDRAAAS